jgi:hypothetical protein
MPSASRTKPRPAAEDATRNRRTSESGISKSLRTSVSGRDSMPASVWVALLGLGAVGVVIPGPVPLGASFVLMGAALLWPGFLARFGGWLARRLPGIWRVPIAFVDPLRSDMQRRYPGSVRA